MAAILFALSWTPPVERLEVLSSDLLVALRHALFGQSHPPESSPTVVIAIDELTYRSPPFAGTPNVFWTPRIATVLDATLAGGAKVVGFDAIFPTSLEPYLPGYERPFLLSLMKGAREGRVVLGKVQHREAPVAPFPAQSMVVGNERNIRPLNVVSDVDEVVRRVPLYFKVKGAGGERRDTSLALELAARALGVKPEEGRDGSVTLGGYTIPDSDENALRINFQGDNDIPTFSLADLYACAEAGEQEYFRRHFKDKVVLIGAVLDLEDRKVTGKRFVTGAEEGAPVTPCRLTAKVSHGDAHLRRDTIPGVYIHAAAINDLLRHDALRKAGPLATACLVAVAALLVVGCTLWLRPGIGALAVAGLAAFWTLIAVFGLQGGTLLPLLPVAASIAIAYSAMLGYRYVVADQQKARIRRLFSLYLAPAVVNRMVESDHLPELGGEMRRVTVWFSDVANFTALSEGLTPNELVAAMNRYFSVVTDIIEEHGGFVDKYIGDAVVAVFGAPLDDPRHAENAVRAALEARDALAHMNAAGAFDGRVITTRTGINTGEVLVGNVGSSRRLNYTVMGDTVNMASRLEGANKAVGTTILISDETVAALPPEIVVRPIDLIRVKGRHAPVQVYEPLAVSGAGEREAAEAVQLARLFEQAQALLRSHRFREAAQLLASLPDDPAAVKLRARALDLAANPPAADWDGVNTLLEK